MSRSINLNLVLVVSLFIAFINPAFALDPSVTQGAAAASTIPGPNPEQLSEMWENYSVVMGYLGPIFGGGIVALVVSLWEARKKLKEWEEKADQFVEDRVRGMGDALASVAERERAQATMLRRRILLVGEEAPVKIWGQLQDKFHNVQARSYKDLEGQDVTGAILVVVPQPAPNEKTERGLDFGPATIRLETFMASVSGMNFPHAALVVGGYLRTDVFGKYNDNGVLVSQSGGRLAVDLDFLIRKA